MTLKENLKTLITDTKRMCMSCPEASVLNKELEILEERIDKPLRVAVVGIMKAGKSTFMNALMEENLLYTGTEETTYTVTWFKYAPQPYLNVIFRGNDFKSEKAKFEDLEKWTVRLKAKENPRINDVKFIEVYYPNETLKLIEFIDTPGLNSAFDRDAQNTMEFLGIEKAKELERVTMDEASKADAIIYAYTRSAGSTDRDVLNEFHGNALTSSTSPINALGVYTKADQLWKILKPPNPLELGQNVSDTNMRNPEMKKLLYTTLPVIAKVVEGFAMLEEKDWLSLANLSKIPIEDLKYEMRHVPIFTSKESSEFEAKIIEFIGSPSQRLSLVDKIGVYGIFEIVNCIINNYSRQEIKDHLYKKSGIYEINELVVSHFGNRSFLIKTQYIFLRLKVVSDRLIRQTDNSSVLTIANSINEQIRDIETNTHQQTFRELKVLQDYYNGLFEFNNEDEYQEFLQVTGEKGRNCEAKLGFDKPTYVVKMAETAKNKSQEWNGKANEFGVSQKYREAAEAASRAYDHLREHLLPLAGE